MALSIPSVTKVNGDSTLTHFRGTLWVRTKHGAMKGEPPQAPATSKFLRCHHRAGRPARFLEEFGTRPRDSECRRSGDRDLRIAAEVPLKQPVSLIVRPDDEAIQRHGHVE